MGAPSLCDKITQDSIMNIKFNTLAYNVAYSIFNQLQKGGGFYFLNQTVCSISLLQKQNRFKKRSHRRHKNRFCLI